MSKKWDYSVSTNTIWTSFDFGTVEAETYDEALEKAKEELKKDFQRANDALAIIGFSAEYDDTQVEITEQNEPFTII